VKRFEIPTQELARGGSYEYLTRYKMEDIPRVLRPELEQAGFDITGRIQIDDKTPGVVVLLQPDKADL